MRKLIVLFACVATFAISSTSCTKYGCPGNFTYEQQFDKELKAEDIVALELSDAACNY